MSIQRYAGDRYTGLSTDTKPADILPGAVFLETDTGNSYFYAAGAWQLGGGSTTWGNITGTLAAQPDLQSELNAKVDVAGDTMTGNLTIDKTTPQIVLDESSLFWSITLSGSEAFYITTSAEHVFKIGAAEVGRIDATGFSGDGSQLTNIDHDALQNYVANEHIDWTLSDPPTQINDSGISETNVTQHEAALSITESQITDLGPYIAGDADTLITDENGIGRFYFNSFAHQTLLFGGGPDGQVFIYRDEAATDQIASFGIGVTFSKNTAVNAEFLNVNHNGAGTTIQPDGITAMSYGSTDTFSIERYTGAGYNTVLLADSSNNVGIGKFPSTKLDVNGTVTGTAFAGDGSQLTNINEAALSITESQITDLGNYTERDVNETISGDWNFTGQLNANGNPVVEETVGTWTPVVVGSTTAGTQLYAKQYGQWKRYGDLIFVDCEVKLYAYDAATSGQIRISGLPVSAQVARSGVTFASIEIDATLPADFQQLAGFIVGSQVRLQYMSTSGVNKSFTDGFIGHSFHVRFSAVYPV